MAYIDYDALLSDVNFNEVDLTDTNENNELPDGYYLCEVQEAEIGPNKDKTNDQAFFQLKVVEPGFAVVKDEDGNVTYPEIANSANRVIFKYYPFKGTDKKATSLVYKDEATGKWKPGQFLCDTQLFLDANDNPLLEKEAFMYKETANEALAVLVGCRIYVKIETKEYNGQSSQFKNLVSLARMEKLLGSN